MIYQRMTDIAACLCAQIEIDDVPGVCFCGVVTGDVMVADSAGDCDTVCGMAWVRLVNAQPVAGVGVPSETAGNCTSEVGFDLEVGILRCIRIPEDGEPLTVEEQAEATELQMDDALLIRRALVCCESMSTKDFILRGYTPMGPLGGLYGGAWLISVVA